MKRALLLAAATVAAHATNSFIPPQDYTFDKYMNDFGRKYSGKEYSERKAIFESNLREIHSVNSQGRTWKAGVNRLTDRTAAELKALRGHTPQPDRVSPFVQDTPPAQWSPLDNLPPSVDWRQRGNVMTPVKNQGNCGSCWAFAATEVLESHLAINTGKLAELSVQQIVSCMPNPNECGGKGGCDGSTSELAFEWIAKNGITDLWNYGYSSGFGDSGKCQWNNATMPSFMAVDGYKRLPKNDGASLKAAVATVGPLVASADARTWNLYHSGVFDHCNQTNPEIDHAVVLAGYGVDEETNTPYWLVRNSWTALFGEDGYIRIKRFENPADEPCGMDINPAAGDACKGQTDPVKVCGVCGLVWSSSYPTGARLGSPSWRPHAEVSTKETVTI